MTVIAGKPTQRTAAQVAGRLRGEHPELMTVGDLIRELTKFQPTLFVGPFHDYEITGEQGINIFDDAESQNIIATIFTTREEKL